jgi:hypothetical protein
MKDQPVQQPDRKNRTIQERTVATNVCVKVSELGFLGLKD